jgi:hypothetical protein
MVLPLFTQNHYPMIEPNSQPGIIFETRCKFFMISASAGE